MSEVPVKALGSFAWARNGVDADIYDAGGIFTLPARIATSFARQGKVEILKPAQKPKAKKTRKKKET